MRKPCISIASDIHREISAVSLGFEKEQTQIDSTRSQSYKGWCVNHNKYRTKIAALYTHLAKKEVTGYKAHPIV